jgi:putative hydrolase of the HAD superfamily
MSELRRPEVVLFDAGNTLVYLDHDALAQAARGLGSELSGRMLCSSEPVAKKRYEAALSGGLSHEDGWYLYVRTMFETAGLTTANAAQAARVARTMHDEFNLWRSVPSDLVPALERGRRAGLRYGIVSNSEGKLTELLERVGLLSHFEVVLDSALEGVRKPDPEIFRRALARMQVAASAALYAGDIPHVDVDGARAAGLDAVLIDTLGHYPEYSGAPRFLSAAALLEALCA